MNKENRESFFSFMTGVCELYGKKASKELLAIYWQALERYQLADILQAINAHTLNPDSGQYMPKPADVVRYIDGGQQSQAMRAWSKVEKAIRTVGGYQSIIFDDAIIHQVISDMGGWIALASVAGDKLSLKAMEFEKRYQGFKINPPKSWPCKLIGIVEARNSAEGFKPPAPVLIGEQAKCLLVHDKGSEQSGPEVKRLEAPLQIAIGKVLARHTNGQQLN